MKKFNLLFGFSLSLLLLTGSTLTAQNLDHVLNEALVQLKADADVKQLEKDLQRIDGVATQLRVIRKISKQLDIYKVQFDHNAVDEFEIRKQLSRHNDVLIVQVNHLLTERQTVPNDPFINDQWQWINPNDADVDADLAWDITTGGQTANGDDIVVAVFDDGGDLDHPDLIDNNWINVHEIAGNGIDDDMNGYIDDVYGWNFQGNNNVDGGSHGVNVAGMIGAVGNDANQGTGINWSVKIMNIRTAGIQEDQVIEFYSYALDQRERYTTSNGAEGSFVVATNSSWGIDGGDPASAPLWCGFYDSLGEAGILSCGATANNNVNIDVVGDLPTACGSEFMVAVTATNNEDNRTFSAYGATTIDVGAPGADIYTTQAGGGYTTTSGTSFASPLTAGVIGLIYSAPCSNLAILAMANPQAAAEQVRDALFDGTEMVGNLDGDVVYGRVNAFNSVQLIMDNCGPCPAPSGIQASDILDISVNLTWANPSDIQTNNLRYRETGAADWIEVVGVTMPYPLVVLTACTEYEVQVAAFCTDEESGYSAAIVFTTEGCCVAPDDLAIADIASTTATANWSSIFAAQSYNLRWRIQGTMTWTDMNLTETTFAFMDLAECSVYEVQIQTVCANATTDFSESVVYSTFGCGACTDFTYCASEGESVEDEWIGEFILGDINNQTPNAPASGYSDYTGTVNTTTLETYSSYDVTLSPAYEGQVYNEYFKVYIDYNQNGTFEEGSELAYDAGDVTQTTVMGEIEVPASALAGLTRLRVVMRFNNESQSCGTYNFGETADYCVTIVEGGPTCDVPDNLSTTSITTISAALSWSSVSYADSYSVDYRAAGAPNWTNTTSIATDLTLDSLTTCQEYEWKVESLCPNGEMSGFSITETFITICPCDIPTGLDTMNVTTTTADLSWTAAAGAISYDVRYRDGSTSTWTDMAAATNSLMLTGLIDCADYEIQVQTVCNNATSNWSSSKGFTTVCFVAVKEVENGVEALTLSPNPFTEVVTSRFNLTENTPLTIAVYAATGQRIATNDYDLSAGAQTVEIKGLEEVSQGVYFVSMTTAKGTKVRRVVKL